MQDVWLGYHQRWHSAGDNRYDAKGRRMVQMNQSRRWNVIRGGIEKRKARAA